MRRPIALATRAVYSFIGFPDQPERHLYLHHDGYPTGAAWRFAAALRQAPQPTRFLEGFLSTQSRCIPIEDGEQASDAEYRYQLDFIQGSAARIEVHCWRRLPGRRSWHPRCGPLPLASFIARFLPGDPL